MKCVEVWDLTEPTEKGLYQNLLRKDEEGTLSIEKEEMTFTKDGNVLIVVWYNDLNTTKPAKFSLDRGQKPPQKKSKPDL
jgi:hypothetical protein